MVTYGIDTISWHVLCSVTINRALGASAGAIVACLTLLDYPASRINSKLAQILQLAQSSPAGPFSSHFDVSVILKVFAFPNSLKLRYLFFKD
jgi:homoserine kinase